MIMKIDQPKLAKQYAAEAKAHARDATIWALLSFVAIGVTIFLLVTK